MERLKEIATIISQNRIRKKVSLYGLPGSGRTNPYLKLYNAINTGDVTTDEEEAAALLRFKGTDSNFRMFKTRFTSKLLTSIFFVDFTKKNSSATAPTYV